MEKILNKHENLFVISTIIIYVVLNSYLMQNYGHTSIQSVIVNTILSIILLGIVINSKRVKYYGLSRSKNPKKFLYFIPLIIISLFNLRNGININNKTNEILFYILTMINVGFIEEIIFRGFLFKMMEKDNVKTAIIVSSLTFGIGHIVNLLNGAEFLPTLLQVCYAVAIGYMLVIVFYKSKSLMPCIIFHIVFNALSILSKGTSEIYSSLILIVMCLAYSLYLNKKVKTN